MYILLLAVAVQLVGPVGSASPPGLPDAPESCRLLVTIAGPPDVLPGYALGQIGDSSARGLSEAPSTAAPRLTIFDHSPTAPWFAGGQTNIIFQANTPFHSPYQGTNSFHGSGEYKTSLLGTLFTAVELGPLLGRHETRYTGEFVFQVESSGGRGLSVIQI
jgi:high affinity Mn2+ porin